MHAYHPRVTVSKLKHLCAHIRTCRVELIQGVVQIFQRESLMYIYFYAFIKQLSKNL